PHQGWPLPPHPQQGAPAPGDPELRDGRFRGAGPEPGPADPRSPRAAEGVHGKEHPARDPRLEQGGHDHPPRARHPHRRRPRPDQRTQEALREVPGDVVRGGGAHRPDPPGEPDGGGLRLPGHGALDLQVVPARREDRRRDARSRDAGHALRRAPALGPVTGGAARTALDRASARLDRIGAVWVGTESKPYAVKPSATIVAEALGITPHVVAADMEFACKAGSEAMQAAVAFVGSGMVEAALAIGMDTAQSKPGDPLEYTAGPGHAAYLSAAAEHALAVVE